MLNYKRLIALQFILLKNIEIQNEYPIANCGQWSQFFPE